MLELEQTTIFNFSFNFYNSFFLFFVFFSELIEYNLFYERMKWVFGYKNNKENCKSEMKPILEMKTNCEQKKCWFYNEILLKNN